MFSDALLAKAEQVLKDAEEQGLKIATAESCTGGLIAALLTAIAGSSSVVDRGFVTYSNASKTQQLGVPAALIKRNGAVSESVAKAMAEGALKCSDADIAVAVTGVAGPGGGTPEKPVGLVYIAVAGKKMRTRAVECRLRGSRANIRLKAVQKALSMLMER